jgi:Flp pilus assembly pilin Flp
MAEAINYVAVRLYNAVSGVREREEGQGLVEYVVLIALIALTLFAALLFFSKELGKVFSEITNIINDALPS